MRPTEQIRSLVCAPSDAWRPDWYRGEATRVIGERSPPGKRPRPRYGIYAHHLDWLTDMAGSGWRQVAHPYAQGPTFTSRLDAIVVADVLERTGFVMTVEQARYWRLRRYRSSGEPELRELGGLPGAAGMRYARWRPFYLFVLEERAGRKTA